MALLEKVVELSCAAALLSTRVVDQGSFAKINSKDSAGIEVGAMSREFHMTVEENILYAKRNVVDSIWKEANIEGIGVTFPDTREIFEGRTVKGLSVDDTVAINNLKHGWQFVFDTIDVPVDLSYIRQINQLVGAGIIFDSGNLRMADVSIGGTRWKPEIPDYDTVKERVAQICANGAGQERALEMFSFLCRSQLFNDGNKRTAQLVTNKMLITDGSGILAVPVEEKRRFEELLIGFYESGDRSKLCDFLSEVAVDGYDSPSLADKAPSHAEPLPSIGRALLSGKSQCDAALLTSGDHQAPGKGAQER